MLAVETWPDVILAVAALLSAVAGVMAGWAALRRTKQNAIKTAEEECLERLHAAREESEMIALKLHQERMRDLETPS